MKSSFKADDLWDYLLLEKEGEKNCEMILKSDDE